MRGVKGKNREDLDVSHEYLLHKRNISAAYGKGKENVTQPTKCIPTRDDSTTSFLKNTFVSTKNQNICKTVKLGSTTSVVLNSSQSKAGNRNSFLSQTKKETRSLNDTSAHLQNVCNDQNPETLNCHRNVSSSINVSLKSTNICDNEKSIEGNSVKANAFLNKPDLSNNDVEKPIHGSSLESNSSLNSSEIIVCAEKSTKGSSVKALNKFDMRNSDVEKIVEGKSLEALSSVSIQHTKPCNTDKTQEQYVSSIKIANIKSSNSNCIESCRKPPKEKKKEESQKGNGTLLINSICKESHQDINNTSASKLTSFFTEHCQKLATELGRIKNSEFSKYREGTNSLFYKLGSIDTNQINEECFIQYVHSLIDYFSDPETFDLATLIYLVVDYLYRDRIKHESLPTYIQNQDTCVFLPPSENCIVSALYEVDKKSLSHLNGLVRNTLNIIHQVIISKKKMSVNGLASLCRVFMETCRRNNDRWVPLFLCCELLRLEHPLAPYLINSLAAVWRDPFSLYDSFSEEEKILLGSIIYGMTEKPLLMDSGLWRLTRKLRSTYFFHPFIIDPHQATQFLTAEIVSRCVKGLFENLWMLASPLIIFVSKETLEWKVHFRNGYILPNLLHFSRCLNEQGFDLFCNLYVDIFSFCHASPYEELLQYFANTALNQGVKFVQDCAAVALLKFIGTTDKHIPAPLRDWFLRNQDNPKLAILVDLYCKKVMESRDSFLLWDDIIIV
ncbi:hypothetical protein AVEN_231651-1 [Araneus ventricosus]|uniref:Uncharacterized protein n=1 Tax=Araneus ventricosus TaxID=182803 RepID=A0A4Y2QRJ6_ARAVE|nr:hypothetical protein AVEN_231651-1 [Araneus ventricosus]